MMNIKSILISGVIFLLLPAFTNGQTEREYLRKGNRLYKKNEYAGSETHYRHAQNTENNNPDADFNLGDALYKQGKYTEAADQFGKVSENYSGQTQQAESFFNQGNALLKEEKFKESIEAYIQSLKLNPDNMAAKYNLAYAQDQLKQQQEQEQQQQDQQNQQDQQDQQQQQDKQDQQQQDKQDNNQQNNNDQQQQQDQEGTDKEQGVMNRDDAQRLLDALAASEKETQDKVQREKAARAKVRVIKNW